MPRFVLLAALFTAVGGCNRQDAECLSRIGSKVAAHARRDATEVNAKLDLSWLNAKREPSLREKILDRLRFENTLTEITFEVTVKDKEVDLKGTVKNALQRQRAIELAETLAGVEKVTDSIEVAEGPDVAR